MIFHELAQALDKKSKHFYQVVKHLSVQAFQVMNFGTCI